MTPKPTRRIEVKRLIDGPVDLVYQAWIDPQHLNHWWGPRGFRTTTLEMDFREGGQWRYIMHGPDGTDYPNRIQFKTILPNRQLLYRQDTDNDEDPFEFNADVQFTAQGDQTFVELSLTCKTDEVYQQVLAYGAIEGGKQHLDRFEEFCMSINGFIIQREFDVTPDVMYKLWTQKDHLSKWMGPKGTTTDFISGEVVIGTPLFYKMVTDQNQTMYGVFTFTQLDAPFRVQYTQSFANEKGQPIHPPFDQTWPLIMKTTVSFEPFNGKTKLTLIWTTPGATDAEKSTFDSNKDNMKMGWTGSFDRLDVYSSSLSIA